MGSCFSAICPCWGSSPRYSKIPEAKVIHHTNFPVAKTTSYKENELANMAGNKIDESLPVYQGAWIDEKFSNKSTYVKKFVWVNRVNKTLNVSDHSRKDRKHQEASLIDVVSVAAGKPDKVKTDLDANGIPLDFKEGYRCLSIKFMRGGIDLKFATEAERDIWLSGILQTWKQ